MLHSSVPTSISREVSLMFPDASIPEIPLDTTLNMVINYPYQITGSGRTKIHVCLFKPDFTPAEGAKIWLAGQIVGQADSNGMLVFDHSPGDIDSNLLKATLNAGGLTYEVSKSFRCNGRTESFRSDQLYVYTDRGIYNPGDRILIRLIAWELLEDYKAIAGAEVTLLLQSPAGKVVGGDRLLTDEFGIAASSLYLPENIAEGDYELAVLYNKTREVARLRVERFVPPVMEIRHSLKRYLTPSQKTLPFRLELSYFSGGKPKSSKLELRILDARNDIVFAREQGESSASFYDFELGGEDLDGIKKSLKLEGPFKILMEVTDNYGQKSTLTRDAVYTERPFSCVLEFDKDDYPAGETVKLLAKVVDLDGKPAGHIALKCEIAEFQAGIETTTDEQGVASFSFTMGNCPGNAIITSPIMPGPLACGVVRFSTPKPMTSKVEEPPHGEGISTNFTVHFSPDFVPVEKVVHVDFTDISGGLVATGAIPITRLPEESYMARGTVKADTWGTMLANLYCCAVRKEVIINREPLSISNVGFITEGQHVTLYPGRELEISINDFKPRLHPGDESTFQIEVKSADGHEAALGASLVDKGVISLLDPFEVSPRDRFYNPQLKVISTGGAAVLTWPVVDRNWGEPWRDIAYSNWGFKSPGARQDDTFRGPACAEMPVMLCKGGMPESMPPDSGGIFFDMASQGEPTAQSQMMESDQCVGECTPPPDPGESRGRGEEKPRRGESGRKITVRTRFPETSLWEPLLRTENGKCALRAKLPDSIGVQRLSIVATDREGGLGMLHRDIEVSQDIFIRPDFPAAMTLGDEIRITALMKNNRSARCNATVSLESSGLSVAGDKSREISIDGGQEEALTWTAKAVRCGTCEFTVSLSGEEFEDSEKRKISVRPPGAPLVEIRRGELDSRASYLQRFTIPEDSLHYSVFLNVSFPNIIPALQAWDSIGELPSTRIGIPGVAGRSLCDCALLSWAEDRPGLEEQIKKLKERLIRGQAELLSMQNPDGGWGWFAAQHGPNGSKAPAGNTYITSSVLQALCEMLVNGIIIQKDYLCDAIEAALGFIWNSRGQDGLWSYDKCCFWETNGTDTCWSLSAEIFDTIVLGSSIFNKPVDDRLRGLKDRLLRHLREHPGDPAFVAHAIAGLLRYGNTFYDQHIVKEMSPQIDFLLTLKRKGYWEPDWYHAYGGMVELNSLILRVLIGYGRERFVSEVREVTTFLLSTREAWGAWHNEMGTARAMRALLQAGAGQSEESSSSVLVHVNGLEAARVRIDGKDPFLSAINLRYMDLSGHCAPGENELEVTYDGKLSAPLVLEIRDWSPSPVRSLREALQVNRSSPSSARMGEMVEVTLDISAGQKVPLIQVTDSIPSNMAIDEGSLRKLLSEGKIMQFQIGEGEVTISIAPVSGSAQLTYRLIALRPGTSLHSGASVYLPTDEGPVVMMSGGPITVSG